MWGATIQWPPTWYAMMNLLPTAILRLTEDPEYDNLLRGHLTSDILTSAIQIAAAKQRELLVNAARDPTNPMYRLPEWIVSITAAFNMWGKNSPNEALPDRPMEAKHFCIFSDLANVRCQTPVLWRTGVSPTLPPARSSESLANNIQQVAHEIATAKTTPPIPLYVGASGATARQTATAFDNRCLEHIQDHRAAIDNLAPAASSSDASEPE